MEDFLIKCLLKIYSQFYLYMQFKKIDAWFGLNGVWFAQL